jgi:hypothetical protein
MPSATVATMRQRASAPVVATLLLLVGPLAALLPGGSISRAQTTRRAATREASLRFLDGNNARTDALFVSHAVTDDETLPRTDAWDATSPRDVDNVRVEFDAPASAGLAITVRLASFAPGAAQSRGMIDALPLSRPTPDVPLRSPFVRLVADRIDAEATGVRGRVLLVALGDEVRVAWRAADGSTKRTALRVGRTGPAGTPRGTLRGTLRVRIVRATAGGRPAVGSDDAGAIRLGRLQVTMANALWAQCGIAFGAPEDADVAVVDPPPPSLLAIADGDGLPAAGGGEIRLVVDGSPLPPVTTRTGERPVGTALRVAEALRAAGYAARVFENPRDETSSGASADVVVRRRDGSPVRLSAPRGVPLGSDRRQHVRIGRADLGDGLANFDNARTAAGTLEERALLRFVADDDPRTIDLVVVPSFRGGDRAGEAFIEHEDGSLVNIGLIDRIGVSGITGSWTQAHEIGHILLDRGAHSDFFDVDSPTLLMDSDSRGATVRGPKRITPEECLRARVESGPDASPPLLVPIR